VSWVELKGAERYDRICDKYILIPAELLPPGTVNHLSHPPREGWCDNRLPPFLNNNAGEVGRWAVAWRGSNGHTIEPGRHRHLSTVVLLQKQILPMGSDRYRAEVQKTKKCMYVAALPLHFSFDFECGGNVSTEASHFKYAIDRRRYVVCTSRHVSLASQWLGVIRRRQSESQSSRWLWRPNFRTRRPSRGGPARFDSKGDSDLG